MCIWGWNSVFHSVLQLCSDFPIWAHSHFTHNCLSTSVPGLSVLFCSVLLLEVQLKSVIRYMHVCLLLLDVLLSHLSQISGSQISVNKVDWSLFVYLPWKSVVFIHQIVALWYVKVQLQESCSKLCILLCTCWDYSTAMQMLLQQVKEKGCLTCDHCCCSCRKMPPTSLYWVYSWSAAYRRVGTVHR